MDINQFCNKYSIGDRDRYVLNKMFKNSDKTENDLLEELKDKIVFKLPEKISLLSKAEDAKNKSQNKNN